MESISILRSAACLVVLACGPRVDGEDDGSEATSPTDTTAGVASAPSGEASSGDSADTREADATGVPACDELSEMDYSEYLASGELFEVPSQCHNSANLGTDCAWCYSITWVPTTVVDGACVFGTPTRECRGSVPNDTCPEVFPPCEVGRGFRGFYNVEGLLGVGDACTTEGTAPCLWDIDGKNPSNPLCDCLCDPAFPVQGE
jgi:hypothetical protein